MPACSLAGRLCACEESCNLLLQLQLRVLQPHVMLSTCQPEVGSTHCDHATSVYGLGCSQTCISNSTAQAHLYDRP